MSAPPTSAWAALSRRVDPDGEGRLGQILLLVVTNAFVGGMVGLERTVLPLIAEADFGIASRTAAIAFIATFGVTKAAANFLVGGLSDRVGRRRLLIAGWLVGLPVPVIIAYAPSWSWVLAANVLLGVNQALTWSMTVVMKVDLAHPRAYGLVIGWNEFAGYAGMALTAGATGWIAASHGLRPEPFYLGLGLALLGLALSMRVRDTKPGSPQTRTDRAASPGPSDAAPVPLGRVLALGTFRDRTLSAASLAGLATNLKDGALWGLLPILLAAEGFSVERVGVVVALYPAVWAGSQLVFGPLSDRVGRRRLIVAGLLVQAAGVALFPVTSAYAFHLLAASIAGLGTGMVYPTLLAWVSEAAEPAWRASALGVYRLWRDLGYAVGALGVGVTADVLGVDAAVGAAAVAMAVAGVAFAGLGRATDSA